MDKFFAVEEKLLNKMLQVISSLPYNSVAGLMKEIELTEFKQVILQEKVEIREV